MLSNCFSDLLSKLPEQDELLRLSGQLSSTNSDLAALKRLLHQLRAERDSQGEASAHDEQTKELIALKLDKVERQAAEEQLSDFLMRFRHAVEAAHVELRDASQKDIKRALLESKMQNLEKLVASMDGQLGRGLDAMVRLLLRMLRLTHGGEDEIALTGPSTPRNKSSSDSSQGRSPRLSPAPKKSLFGSSASPK